ncbi:hypothetical protein EKL97_05715 [Flavobacterium sp. LS1P28]|uniref:hypothetical protein n=1 Tax=Flavobacterium sp. LS1P28 TaxID=2497752 RepID=UPI000F823026|nr:hypothetical protein [Flavobacterium sp. LS1P28]RTY83042.1 hypothetical protein EKL97_05715 [Flavobacterium sp. LS1P28]
MKNKFYSFIFICFSLLVISCEANSNNVKLAEKIADDFYVLEKTKDYKSIDLLMSYQFYQVTPYEKFVNFLKVKREVTGGFKHKKLESYNVVIISGSNNRIVLNYEVEYQKKKMTEQFIMENNDGDFKIINYVLK